MILFGSSISPFVRKAMVLASEKGMTLDLRPIRLGDPDPAFRAASPLAKMPALSDGDFHLADSTAICVYLDAVGPGPKLIPDEPQARATAFWWDEFADTELFAQGRLIFFNRVVRPLFLRQDGDEAAATAAEREGLPPLLDLLEARLPEDGYLIGGDITLADIAVASPFVNFDHLGLETRQGRPRLAAFLDRMLGRPSFTPLIAAEQDMLTFARTRVPQAQRTD